MEANYKFQGQNKPRRVWGLDSSYTAGYGVVYDLTSTDKAAVTVRDLARAKYVRNPTVTYHKNFAGVVVESKTKAGQLTIAEPGSDCLIYVGETSATAGQVVSCDCGVNAGKWYLGSMGRSTLGSAVLLETVDAVGLYHARLCTGVDEGLLQMLTPVLAGGAIVLTPFGRTLINGGTVNTDHCTATLANGTEEGQVKSVKITTTIGNSKNFVYTVTTGEQFDGSTDLATLTFNTGAEESSLVWKSSKWQLVGNTGTTIG